MTNKHPLVESIDQTYAANRAAEENGMPFRSHLGGSMIGKKCSRELYYSFRWFKRPAFQGRILRLFDRGHAEEFSFVDLLRSQGIEVRAYSEQLMYHPESDSYMTLPWRDRFTPPSEPEIEALCDEVSDSPEHIKRAKAQGVELKQWRILDVDGHFGGSLDGISNAPFDIPVYAFEQGRGLVDTGRVIPAGTEFLNEFKTHNTKSFVDLVSQGVKLAKPVHWTQMQIYMHKRDLKFAMYMAVNKNDDDLWVEIVEYDGEGTGNELVEKARNVVYSPTVPNRIGKHASWYDCKFCEFAKICHYGETSQVDRNCRSCAYSQPVDGGQWRCNKWQAIIPSDAILKGCDSHKLITD